MLVLGLPPEQVPWGREIEERVTSAPAHSGTISVLPKRKGKLSSELSSETLPQFTLRGEADTGWSEGSGFLPPS